MSPVEIWRLCVAKTSHSFPMWATITRPLIFQRLFVMRQEQQMSKSKVGEHEDEHEDAHAIVETEHGNDDELSEEETNIVATVATVESSALASRYSKRPCCRARAWRRRGGGPQIRAQDRFGAGPDIQVDCAAYKLARKPRNSSPRPMSTFRTSWPKSTPRRRASPLRPRHRGGSLTIMQNVSTENSGLPEDSPPLVARLDDTQNNSSRRREPRKIRPRRRPQRATKRKRKSNTFCGWSTRR